MYGQSVNLPALMWFRLHIEGGDGDYTNTADVHEPRPCVLSYRTAAKTLKGLGFRRRLDAGADQREAFLFAAKGGDARAVCLWDDRRDGDTITLRLSDRPAGASDARLIDLFGNAVPLRVADNSVTVPVGPDPTYVTWRDAAASDAVAVVSAPAGSGR